MVSLGTPPLWVVSGCGAAGGIRSVYAMHKNLLRNSLLLTGTALALSSVAPSTSGLARLQGIAHADTTSGPRGSVVSSWFETIARP